MATVKRKGDILSYSNGQTTDLQQQESMKANFNKMMAQKRQEERAEREKLVLWLQPITTFNYFCRQLLYNISNGFSRLFQFKMAAVGLLFSLLSLLLVLKMNGPHQSVSKYVILILSTTVDSTLDLEYPNPLLCTREKPRSHSIE